MRRLETWSLVRVLLISLVSSGLLLAVMAAWMGPPATIAFRPLQDFEWHVVIYPAALREIPIAMAPPLLLLPGWLWQHRPRRTS
jgi:hypothetical protein